MLLDNANWLQTILVIIIPFGLVAVTFLLYGATKTLILNVIQFFVLSPLWIITFPIHGICNTHDISWGTKDLRNSELRDLSELFVTMKHKTPDQIAAILAKREENKKNNKEVVQRIQSKFEKFRTRLLFFWIITNGLLVGIMTHVVDVADIHVPYLNGLYISILSLIGFKFVGSMLYLITSTFGSYQRRTRKTSAAVADNKTIVTEA